MSPTEFHYWENQERPSVRRLRWLLRSFTGINPQPSTEQVEQFAADYYRADPVAEAFVDECYINGDPTTGRALLDQALEQGIDSLPNAPQSLKTLMAEYDQLPGWVDLDKVALGAKTLRRYGQQLYEFYGAVTLQGYYENSVVKPLILTGAYANERTHGRFLETAQYWQDVTDQDGLLAGGAGRKTSMRVRIMHVFVRRQLLKHPDWQSADWGVPINVADASVTISAGGFGAGVFLYALGYFPSKQEIEAMMHFWRYAGHLLGVQPSWAPDTIADGIRFSYMIATRGSYKAGSDGIDLCQSYTLACQPDTKQPRFSRQRLEQTYAHWRRLGFVGLFALPETRRDNHLPKSTTYWALPLLLRHLPINALSEIGRRLHPAVADRLDKQACQQREHWLKRQLGERKAEYTAVTQFRQRRSAA